MIPITNQIPLEPYQVPTQIKGNPQKFPSKDGITNNSLIFKSFRL